MKLAINYSKAAAELVADGRIQIDFFKTPNWPDMIEKAVRLRPVAIHFEIATGTGQLQHMDWTPIETALASSGTPFVNVHLLTRPVDFPDIPPETQDPAHTQHILDTFLQDVGVLVEHFGPQRVIAENLPYIENGVFNLRPAADPELICKVVRESGCGFLFDISHARMAAYYLGVDEWEYIDRLPMERLREMHFTGLQWWNGKLQDHLSILPEDWPALDRALERIRGGEWPQPWLLAYEYGGEGKFFAEHTDPALIAEHVPMLWERIKGLSSPSRGFLPPQDIDQNPGDDHQQAATA
jgi:uncharacterized protein (UPF0276 family)